MIKKIFNICAVFTGLILITIMMTEQFTYARAGGGRSFGSRGSRSYSIPSSPSRQSSQPSQPSRDPAMPYNQPQGGFLRNMGMGIAGGFLGSMLFRGLGMGSSWGDGQGGGIGIFEILVIGGLGFMLYKYYKKRKGDSGQRSGGLFSFDRGGFGDSTITDRSDLSAIITNDPSFNEANFKDNVMDIFFKVQAAWMNRDLSSVKSLLTDEMREIFQEDIDSLLSSKKINRLENIAVRSVDITEAWQESGLDYITTLIYANILDYTIDEKSGEVVNGSKTDPTKFEEYWTFTRTSQANKWMLSAINQA
jgi:predicted lipid-binding transport protein (Tim44 family)